MTPVLIDDIAVLQRLLADRWSCRGYTDQQVPRDVIEQLLATAQRTPSWCNTQPWHAFVTSGAATDKLRDALFTTDEGYGVDFDFPAAYTGVHQERRRESGWQPSCRTSRATLDEAVTFVD